MAVAAFSRIARGILTVEAFELRIHLWLLCPKSERALEESFRRHCKKLRRIFRAIRIEHSRRSCFICRAQRLKLLIHYLRPCQVFIARPKCWRAISLVIFEVELMSKLVKDQVRAVP